jgi:hypothetical protein
VGSEYWLHRSGVSQRVVSVILGEGTRDGRRVIFDLRMIAGGIGGRKGWDLVVEMVRSGESWANNVVGGHPPVFLDVWKIKDFKSFVYGSVVSKGLRGHFFRMCGKERSYGRHFRVLLGFVGSEGMSAAIGEGWRGGTHGDAL